MQIYTVNSLNLQYKSIEQQGLKQNKNFYNTDLKDTFNSNKAQNINFNGWFWNRNKTKPVINPNNLAMFDNARNLSKHIMCGGFGNVIMKYDCYGCKGIFERIKKEGNIDTIIYLGESAAVHEKMQKSIQKAGLKYFNLSIWDFDNWFHEDGDKISVKQNAVDNLKELFNILNSADNVVIGCDQGVQRTSQALFFNHYLNSKNKISGEDLLNACKRASDITLLNNFVNVKKLFNALSSEQKAELGLTDKKLPELEITDLGQAAEDLKKFLLTNK